MVQVVGLINSLCAGGAQRQMALLGKNLKRRGVDFKVITYHDNSFFKPILDEAQIPVSQILDSNRLARALSLYRSLRREKGKIIISFLDGPNVYAELARIPGRPFGLIVSERVDILGEIPRSAQLRLQLHHLADFLVTNSFALQGKILARLPKLTPKTRVILNCVDLEHFKATPLPQTTELRLLVLARFSQQKNAFGLLESFRQVQAQSKRPIVLDWYGDNYFIKGVATPLSQIYLDLKQKIAEYGLQESFRIHPPSTDPRALIEQAHAMVLASFYEGFPNVVCEALASGRPVLVSDVCDNGLLVQQGKNGMLFNPYSTEGITSALVNFAQLSWTEQQAMGTLGRQTAETLLSERVFVDHWLEIIQATATKKGFA